MQKINFGLTKPYHIIKKMFARLQTLSVLFGTDVPLADDRAHSVFKKIGAIEMIKRQNE